MGTFEKLSVLVTSVTVAISMVALLYTWSEQPTGARAVKLEEDNKEGESPKLGIAVRVVPEQFRAYRVSDLCDRALDGRVFWLRPEDIRRSENDRPFLRLDAELSCLETAKHSLRLVWLAGYDGYHVDTSHLQIDPLCQNGFPGWQIQKEKWPGGEVHVYFQTFDK